MDIQEYISMRAALREWVSEHGADVLRRCILQIMRAVPELIAVYWCQYIPYFNDGDPCVFTRGPLMGLTSECVGDEFDGPDSKIDADRLSAQIYDICRREVGVYLTSEWSVKRRFGADRATEVIRAAEPFTAVPDEVFEGAFGKYALVAAWRDRDVVVFSVSEYEPPS